MSRRSAIALVLLLTFAAGVRSLGVCRPLLGNFATKNVVYAMIARNWAAGRAPAWLPTLDCLANGQRSLHLLEYPVSAYLAGGLWWAVGGSLDAWGRVVSILFSTVSVGLMFLLVRRWYGETAAWGASVVLALSPVSIIYGQSFMLEASVVCFTLATLLAWTRWLDFWRWSALAVASLSLGLLLLTKVYMLVLLLPLAAMLVQKLSAQKLSETIDVADGWQAVSGPTLDRVKRRLTAYLIAAAAVLVAMAPAGAWYWQVLQASSPESPLADRLYYSIRDSASVHHLPHPLLAKADYYRQVLDDLSGVALTPVGFFLALLGLANRRWRKLLPWLLSMAALWFVLPLKFYKMNYYYLVVLPPLCILAGLGWQIIYERLKPSPRWIAALALVGLAFSLRYAVKPAFVTPPQDRNVLAAARTIRELTSPDEPVVTMHGSTIDLLYYCDRRGWAVSPETKNLSRLLPKFRESGAKYLVVSDAGRMTSQVKRWLLAMPNSHHENGFSVYRLSCAERDDPSVSLATDSRKPVRHAER